jgi:dipeptidase E
VREFHEFNTVPVLGLREGSWLEVNGTSVALRGDLQARLFRHGMEPVEVEPGTDLSGF